MSTVTRMPTPVPAGVLGSALLTLLVGGCTEDAGPLAPPALAPPAAAEAFHVTAAGRDGVPFHLSGDAALLSMERAPNFGPPLFGKSDFGGRCSVPSDLLLSFSVEGTATRLGRFTAIAEHCSVVDFVNGGSAIHDGVMVFTAANGDELWTHYTRPSAGEATPEDHEFVGGTGRFAGASGSGLGHPDCDRSTGLCTFDLEGIIHYHASDRAD